MAASARMQAFVEELGETVLTADGFDEAFVGIGYRCANQPCAVYDRDKCIEVLEGQGMTHDEAEEFFDFNTAGAYVGEQTPIFVTRPPWVTLKTKS